jgi:hypothetical protein
MRISRIKELWKKHGYEILICSVLIILIILAIYRKMTGKTGTWSKNYHSDISMLSTMSKIKRKKGGDSKGETECRRVLQKIFNRPFNKIRPNFLRNDITDGNNLEIDCYDDNLKIGVEYNGSQHYNYIPFFHKTKDAFYNQKYRDDIKRRLCRKNGILLIEVPYTVPNEKIESFLVKELKKYKKIPVKFL